METPVQTRIAVEMEIRVAFRDVTLGGGISIRQAQFIDFSSSGARGAHSTPPARQGIETEWSRIPLDEIINDWSRVSLDELERDCIAHLDALGFRYYIPALMLSVVDRYDPSSLRVIGTLDGLYPKKDDGWEYHMHRYSLLNFRQKAATARFLAALPKLVQLESKDQKVVERALRNYWGEYLQADATGDGKRE
ncbi:MAG: DUF6714 family protein [Terriglobia bacterium]